VSVKFVHAADLHLDRPFSGLRDVNEEVGDALRDATLAAYDRVIDLCIEERVDFALFAGDLFDSQDRSIRAQVRFVRGLARLADEGIPAFIVHGNHDPWSEWSEALEWPAMAHRFGPDDVESVPVTLGDETLCCIYGISFGKREVKANLARRFKREPGDAPLAIGLLHADVGGRTGESPYAPCSVEDLRAAGFDYWAIGHIHVPQVIRPAEPCIVYPGSTQGLDPNQTGPRGCYLVELQEDREPKLEFRPASEAEWQQEGVSIDAHENVDDLLRALEETTDRVRSEAQSNLVLLRLILRGAGPLHGAISRAGARTDWLQTLRDMTSGGRPMVWVESMQDETRPAIDLDARAVGDDFMGEFLRMAEAATENDEALQALREELADLLDDREVKDTFAIADEDLRRWFEHGKLIGAERLVQEGDA
jgi:exonuclease SbcD